MARERLPAWIILAALQLVSKAAGHVELQRFLWRQRLPFFPASYLVLSLRLLNDTKRAERLDGYARVPAIYQPVSYLIEYGRQHLFDSGLADAAPLCDISGKTL